MVTLKGVLRGAQPDGGEEGLVPELRSEHEGAGGEEQRQEL